MHKWHIFRKQRFEWNENKRRSNYLKHKVDFADAVGVLFDQQAITIEDVRHDEQRFVSLGLDHLGILTVVTYTYRKPNSIRLISARKAEKSEYRSYWKV